MRKTNRTLKLDLEFSIPTLVSDDGTTFTVTDQEINAAVVSLVDGFKKGILSNKSHCLKLDSLYEINSFKQNCDGLVYDESNPVTYKHFVHEFLKNYYSGADIIDMSSKLLSGDKSEESVRELILMHLLSGEGNRDLCFGEMYCRVRPLESIKEQKQFWRFVLDSGIIDPYAKFKLPVNLKGYGLNKVSTVFELVIYKCWRDGSLEVLKWVIETYQIDLYKISKFSITYVLYTIHDNEIHATYRNGVLRRKYNYNSSIKMSQSVFSSKWENKSLRLLVEFIRYFKFSWPGLDLSFNDYSYLKVGGDNPVYVAKSIDEYIEVMFGKYAASGESIDDLLEMIR